MQSPPNSFFEVATSYLKGQMAVGFSRILWRLILVSFLRESDGAIMVLHNGSDSLLPDLENILNVQT